MHSKIFHAHFTSEQVMQQTEEENVKEFFAAAQTKVIAVDLRWLDIFNMHFLNTPPTM